MHEGFTVKMAWITPGILCVSRSGVEKRLTAKNAKGAK
jgi:hypothetical protein